MLGDTVFDALIGNLIFLAIIILGLFLPVHHAGLAFFGMPIPLWAAIIGFVLGTVVSTFLGAWVGGAISSILVQKAMRRDAQPK